MRDPYLFDHLALSERAAERELEGRATEAGSHAHVTLGPIAVEGSLRSRAPGAGERIAPVSRARLAGEEWGRAA